MQHLNKNGRESGVSDIESKKDVFSELFDESLKNYYSFSNQTNWKEFYGNWSQYPSLDTREREINLRKLWINMRQGGKMFADFLEEKTKDKLEAGDLSSVYRIITIYESLLSESQVSFYSNLLANEKVLEYFDGSVRHTLLSLLGECGGPEAERAIIDYTKKFFSEEDKNSEVGAGVTALYQAYGKDKDKVIEVLNKEIGGFSEWLENNPSKSFLFLSLNTQEVYDVFDLDLEKKHIQQLEEELAEIKAHPEILEALQTDSYDIFMGSKKAFRGSESYKEDEWIGWRSPEKYRPENTQEFDRAVLRGSVVLAIKLGKDPKLARDIDIFFKQDDLGGKIRIEEFESLGLAKAGLPVTVYERVRKIVETHGLENLHVNVVHASPLAIKRMSLVDDEPELVLWNPVLEIKSKLSETEGKKDELKKELTELGIADHLAEQVLSSTGDTEELAGYNDGTLTRGSVPPYLMSRSNSLAAALRLVDWGERFDIQVNTGGGLSAAEMMAAAGDLSIKIPPDPGFGDWIEPAEGVIDQAFFNVVDKKDLYVILEKQFPVLAGIMRAIKAAGGIRDYVRQEYGEVYLTRGVVDLDAIRFTGDAVKELSVEDHGRLVSTWQGSHILRKLFHGDAELFLNSYLALDRKLVVGKNSDELAELMIQPEIGRLTNSEYLDERKLGDGILVELALAYQQRGMMAISYYQTLKQLLKDRLFQEKNKRLRKNLIKAFVRLGNTGEDMTIANDFAELVKKESTSIKTKHSEEQEALSEDGMLVLRGLLEFKNETAYRAIYELLTNPGVDNRIKKLCLAGIKNSYDTFVSTSDIRRQVETDLTLTSNLIPWQDYASLVSIQKISSTTARDIIKYPAQEAFLDIRNRGQSVAELRQELAPGMGYELFLPLYKIFDGKQPQLTSWGKLLGSVKSNTLRDSFIFNIANLLNYNNALLNNITENIVESDQPTKERALLVDRLLKKIHFLSTLNTRDGGTKVDLNQLIAETKPASLLETKLDGMMVAGLYEITGREDLTSDKIQKLFNSWQDPEPVFVFLAQLASKTRSTDHKRALELTGEMLAYMDPPNLDEWKRWRYDTTNPIVKAQLQNLTEQQIKAYAEDEFVNLGEVLVGLLPSDKPDKIRDAIFHGIRHNEEPSGSRTIVRRLVNNFFTATEGGTSFDSASVISQDRQNLDKNLELIDRCLNLESDRRVLEYLPKELERWQKVELNKRRLLIEQGYDGNATRSDIEKKISELQTSGASFDVINKLASLKPGYFPKPIQKFFERYGLAANSSPEEIVYVKREIEQALTILNDSSEFKELISKLFGALQDPSRTQLQSAKRDFQAAKTLLQLCSLTPQLIAFNKISNDKKKATLQRSIDFLKNYFEQDQELVAALHQTEAVIAEVSHPVGKDNLAIIFTDSPLVSLTIGRYPAGATSCQSYTNGDSVLAAYMADAYTKICLVVDLNKLPAELKDTLDKEEDGTKKMELFNRNTHSFLNASVARRLTKKVDSLDNNQPQLFLEPVYTPLDRRSITRLLDAYAVNNLQPRLGIDLVKGGGFDDTVRVAESRNRIQYEDGENGGPGGGGAGLGDKRGSYSMPARPIKETDYLLF